MVLELGLGYMIWMPFALSSLPTKLTVYNIYRVTIGYHIGLTVGSC